MRQELISYYNVNNSKIEVITGGIDYSDFPHMNKQEIYQFKSGINISNKDKIILFVGRIMPVKGIDYLIYSFYNVLKFIPNSKLLLVGGSMLSHYDRKMIKLVKKLHIQESVDFIGLVPQEIIYKYYNICDVVVVPSTYEPFGMVCLQTVIFKKPLVCSNVVGALDYINSYPLLKIVSPYSAKELAEALKIVLLDENFFLSNLKFNLKILNWSEVAKRLEDIFFKVMQEKQYLILK